jgi:hypothetical protein
VRRDDALLIRWLDDDCPRTVAEQDAGTAIVPVDQFGDDLGTNDECALRFTCANKLVGRRQGIDKNTRSGVVVPITIRSMSSGLTSAASIAAFAASIQRLDVVSSSAA